MNSRRHIYNRFRYRPRLRPSGPYQSFSPLPFPTPRPLPSLPRLHMSQTYQFRSYSDHNTPNELPPAPPSAEELRKVVLPLPMKLEFLEIESAERLFQSEDWVCEQKVDGIRSTVAVTPKAQHTFGSGNGTPLSSTVAGPFFPIVLLL